MLFQFYRFSVLAQQEAIPLYVTSFVSFEQILSWFLEEKRLLIPQRPS